MDVRFVGTDGIEEHAAGDVPALLARSDGFIWIDVPEFDDEAANLLTDVFHTHRAVIEACRRRNHTPSIHAYEQHFFVILHTPLLGAAGHVHLLELDLLVGRDHLVTVHGPINPAV